jgi:hypothetical protein
MLIFFICSIFSGFHLRPNLLSWGVDWLVKYHLAIDIVKSAIRCGLICRFAFAQRETMHRIAPIAYCQQPPSSHSSSLSQRCLQVFRLVGSCTHP